MKSKIYQAVFKNVPLPLMDELRKYAKHQSVYSTRWKMRKPIPGQKYGWGGALRRENATAADLYVDMTKHHIVREKYKEIADLNDQLYELEQKYDRLLETFKILDRRGDKERRCRSPF